MDVTLSVTTKYELRAVIRFLNAKKVEPVNIHRELCEIYGQNCMSVQQVRFWCREFANGRTDFHDEQRSGRLSLSDEVVAKVEEILRKDRRITIRDLALRVPEICPDSVHKIVTEKLGYNKVCARWVP